MQKLESIIEKLKSLCPLQASDRVLIAYSGGVDSALLLKLLHEYSREEGFTLGLFHLHHGIRKESDQEEVMVREIAKDYDLDLFVEHVDAPSYKKEHKLSLEEAARVLRYERIDKVMREQGYNLVALGHHLDDQVETFFLNLFRGSGLTGLTGMSLCDDQKYRPLLGLRKEEIYALAQELGLKYVEDQTNQDASFARNKLRLELIPYLKEEYDPKLYEHLERTIGILTDEDNYLREQVLSYPLKRHYKLTELRAIDGRLLGRYLRELIDWVVGINNVSFEQVEALKRLVTGTTQGELIIKGARFSREQMDFFIHLEGEGTFEAITLKEGMNELSDMKVELFFSDEPLGDFYLNRSDIRGDLQIRPRREGDRIRLAPTQTKDVRVLFIDKKIPRSQRPMVKLLADDHQVFWIMGYRRAFSKKKSGDYACLRIHKN